MIKIVCKTIEIGAQFSSAGFGGIDRISPRNSGLGRSYLPEKGDRFIMGCAIVRLWVVMMTAQTDGGGFCVGALGLNRDGDGRGLRSVKRDDVPT